MSNEWEDFDWPDLDRGLTLRQLLYNTKPENLISVAVEYAQKHNIEGFFPFPQRNESHEAMIDRWVLEVEMVEKKALAENDRATAESYKDAQRKKAKKSRSPHRPLIERLLKKYPDDSKAKELWPHLYPLLEEAEFDPEESMDDNGPVYLYYPNGKKKILTLHRFETIISEIRKK